MEPAKKSQRSYLSVTSIGLMTAAAVVTSLRGLPLLAKEEMTMFAYLAFTVIFYLIPASLVSAELGGAFADRKGGVYAWVGQAFGSRWGFLAIWLQWIQNVVWYPVALTFGAAALAYTIGVPSLAQSGLFVGLFCIVAYWLATSVVLQGVEVFAKAANWTFVLGTIVPGIVLVGLLAYWLAAGNPIGWQHLTDPALSANGHALFWPVIHGFGTVAFLAGIILLFAGVEAQAVHVTDMRKPSTGYPVAIGLASILSLAIFALGALPIAAIVPYDQMSLQSAVFDTFNAVIANIWHMDWLVPVLSLLVGIGAISGVFAWLGSPSRGLLATADDGELPPALQVTNRHGMPTHILLVQGAVVTVMSMLLLPDQGRIRRVLPNLGDDGGALSDHVHADVCGRDQTPLFEAGASPALHCPRRSCGHVAGRRRRVCRRAVQLLRVFLPSRPIAGGITRALCGSRDRRHRGVLRHPADHPR